MAANKTRATDASVEAYFDAIADDARRADCRALAALMGKVSKQPATMWGSSIVGFGSYHYVYDSGREGDASLVGFSSRKGDISLYLRASSDEHAALLERLGRHKKAKGCVYIRRMADVDAKVLETIVALSIAQVRARYG